MASAAEVYALMGKGELWETAARCHQQLHDAGIPHAICGGIAVCLYGYQRNTVDIDMIIRPEDAQAVQQLLSADWTWDESKKEFRTTSGVAIQFLLSGERAGKGAEVFLPDPSLEKVVTQLEGLPVLRLSKLIETKLACGSGNLRRTHRDFGDVVELIAVKGLDSSFARFLHKSVRQTFRELVQRARLDP